MIIHVPELQQKQNHRFSWHPNYWSTGHSFQCSMCDAITRTFNSFLVTSHWFATNTTWALIIGSGVDLNISPSANKETQWYLPNGAQVQNLGSPQPSMTYSRTRSQSPAAVCLNHNPVATTTGVFHCDILDASGDLQSIYVGIYTATTGEPCTLKRNEFV